MGFRGVNPPGQRSPLLALLLLLLDEPQAAATSATATMTPTHATDLVPRKLIPLLLHMVETSWNTRLDAPNVI